MTPRVEIHDGFRVVRDDEQPGGTKARALPAFLAGAASEVVYASPAYGYAQVALAHAAAATGRRAVVFVAKRKQLHPRTQEAADADARIVQVPHGYLSNVQAKARHYAEQSGATLLPFGFDSPRFSEALRFSIAEADPFTQPPAEVWTVAGSGTLTRTLQQVWPSASFHAVAIGKAPDVGRAELHQAPEAFERNAKHPPPFPSCSNYDAKAWRFMRELATPGAVFWNVAR